MGGGEAEARLAMQEVLHALWELLAECVLELAGGGTSELAGLFVQSRTSPACPIAEQLGCRIEESPMGTFVGADGTQETSVPGVFAAGDTARAAGSLTFAVSDGAMAGAGAHRSLIFPPA